MTIRQQEQRRVRAHLLGAVSELESRNPTLSAEQRRLRQSLIERLRRYADAGRFPLNLDFPNAATPYFVDAAGTRCAVADLMEHTGDHSLVEAIAKPRNNARVRDLADEPALHRWLDRTGIALAEAARIQPEYCGFTAAMVCFCTGQAQGVLETTIVEGPTDEHPWGLQAVTAVHGTSSYKVGDEIPVDQSRVVTLGQRWLIAVGGGANVTYTYEIWSNGLVGSFCDDELPTLTISDAVTALLADSCEQTLYDQDPAWNESLRPCDDGCSASGSQTAATGSALLALLLARRRRRLPAIRP
ncbi:MAG: hypothetical protein AB7O24_30205 [Kofleriaceae bacterium]